MDFPGFPGFFLRAAGIYSSFSIVFLSVSLLCQISPFIIAAHWTDECMAQSECVEKELPFLNFKIKLNTSLKLKFRKF